MWARFRENYEASRTHLVQKYGQHLFGAAAFQEYLMKHRVTDLSSESGPTTAAQARPVPQPLVCGTPQS